MAYRHPVRCPLANVDIPICLLDTTVMESRQVCHHHHHVDPSIHHQQQAMTQQPTFMSPGQSSAGQAVLTTYIPVRHRVVESYAVRQSVVLGSVMVVLGVLAFSCDVIQMTAGDMMTTIGQGLLCGMLVSRRSSSLTSLRSVSANLIFHGSYANGGRNDSVDMLEHVIYTFRS